MHLQRIFVAVSIALLAFGCASQPKPPSAQLESEIIQRLHNFSASWSRGDSSGVAHSFAARTPEENEFAQSLGELAAAQQALVKEQPAIPSTFTGIPGDRSSPLVTLNRPWHLYAAAAARPPQRMLEKDGVIMAQLLPGDGNVVLSLRKLDGRWLIEPGSFATSRPLPLVSDSLQRQIRLTGEATRAIRARDWDALHAIFQQMHQQQMVDRISDSADMRLP